MSEATNEVTEEVTETVETPTEQAENTENAEPGKEESTEKPEKTFTQKELDDILTKRIERERETVSKKVAQEARDAWIAEQNYTWDGKPIKTEAEYKEALREQEMREKYSELPEEVQKELIENKRFREQYEAKEKESQARAAQDADFQAFLDTYPDVDPKTIPQSVWDDVAKGKSLVDSYVKHENQALKQKLSDLEEGKQIEQKNAENANSSTGSVSDKGTAPARFTREQVAKMSREEVNKHWKAINDSMKSWE